MIIVIFFGRYSYGDICCSYYLGVGFVFLVYKVILIRIYVFKRVWLGYVIVERVG